MFSFLKFVFAYTDRVTGRDRVQSYQRYTPEEQEAIDAIYEGRDDATEALGRKIKKYYDKRQADQADKYQKVSQDLINQFKNIEAKLEAAQAQGQSTVEVSTDISPWTWEHDLAQNEQTRLVKRITQEKLKSLVNTPGVTLEAFCPQWDLYEGRITCLTKPGGKIRAGSDCMVEKCWVSATLSKPGT